MGKVISFDEVKNRKTQLAVPEKVKFHPRDKSEDGISAGYYHAIDAFQDYALKAFCQSLKDFRRCKRIRLPENFDQIMRDPKDGLPDTVLFKLESLLVKQKQSLVYAMVSAVHEGWVKDNPEFFFDEKYAGERFMYLDLELCGVYVYKDFLDMIMETVRRLGLEYPYFDWDAESMYACKRHKFLCEHNLTSVDNLAEYIANCGDENSVLSPEISTTLKRDSTLVNELVAQVILRTPIDETKFC